MTATEPAASPRWLAGICGALGLYALIAGAISFGGWAFNAKHLTDWDNDGISIHPNATLCVMFSGLALLLLVGQRRRAALLCGSLVALIGGLTLTQSLIGLSFGIDTLLMFGREWGGGGVAFPGRMGPPASLLWTLIGTALTLTAGNWRARRLAPALVLTTLAISGLSLVGYLYGAEQLFTLPYLTVIALPTSTFILAVSLGVLLCHSALEPMRTLLDAGSAGLLARRVLPALVLFPIALGFLRVEGQRFGLYDTGLSTALLALLLIVFLTTFLWRSLRTVRAHEEREHDSRRAELERRRELEALLEAAPVAIWVAQDRHCRVIKGNPAAAALLRMSVDTNMSRGIPEAGTGRQPAIYIDGRSVTPAALPIRTAARTGEAVPNQELEFRFPDGSTSWAYGNAVPLFDADNEVRGAIGTFVDVTALKKAEDSLRETDRRKDEFLATLAHELRNPLAPVRNAVAILRLKEPDAPESQWARDVIDRQIQQMARLIDDLLDLSRISLGKIELKRERVDLTKVLHGAVEASRPLIEERRHALIVKLPPQTVYLLADATRLAQALCNVLNNAAKYSERGGRIVLSAQLQGNAVVVTVRDNGIGIPREMLGRVFEMFTQVDRSFEGAQGGLGIGLTLVKRVVELHGGRVEARSDGPGRGSELEVRLPVLEVARPSEQPLLHSRERSTRPSSPRRVLVVDDNRDAADSLELMLRMSGNDVRTVYDGEEAVRAALEFQPDVVLLDIGLPKMNGYETARAIRGAPGGADMALIAVTGWGHEEDRRRSKDAGFDYHLVKPVGAEFLMELLASLPARREPLAPSA